MEWRQRKKEEKKTATMRDTDSSSSSTSGGGGGGGGGGGPSPSSSPSNKGEKIEGKNQFSNSRIMVGVAWSQGERDHMQVFPVSK